MYSTVHLLGVEETANGRVEYALFVSGSAFVVRRKVQDGGDLNSEVVAPDLFASHAVKGRQLADLVAEARAALNRGERVVPVS